MGLRGNGDISLLAEISNRGLGLYGRGGARLRFMAV